MDETPDRYCSNCGHELTPEDQFCPNCGRPVHETATVPTPEANVPVPPPPQAAAPSPQQAEGTQQSRSRRNLLIAGCLGLVGVVALLILVLVAAIALSGGSGGGGDEAAKKDKPPANAPANTPANTPASTPENTPASTPKNGPPAAKDASKASLSDVRMATDGDGKNPTVVFSPKDTFYCVGNLENAPDNTTVTTLWIASDVEGLKPNTKLKQISDTGGSGPFRFELSTDGPWPKDKYVVGLYLNDEKNPRKALAFEVR